MNKNLKLIGGIIGFLILAYILWYFSNLVVYLLIAAVLAFIGHPLVSIIDKLKIGKHKMPHALSAGVALIALIGLISLFFLIFVPVITRQANIIASIDFAYLGKQVENNLQSLEKILLNYNILDNDQTLEILITNELENLVNLTSAETIFKNVLGFAGSFFLGVFSVIFLTFFFLRDEHLFRNIIMMIVPVKYEEQASAILTDTSNLLSRYFIGLSLELLSMMTLISISLYILGVKNALLIGFLGGLMNIIPYLGPIIGATIGVIIGVTGSLSMEMYGDILSITLIILATFAGANLLDNFLLQPLIYSTSVKAHPIEIFLVILMAGSLAGIPGMILAIPSYTVLRIVAKQFFSNVKVVKRLTKDI
ncbi:MAG: AI-2E family transporter [Bacteroidales bacterium]|nr:AI-2E family transporter [Bacteroidales bacterium]